MTLPQVHHFSGFKPRFLQRNAPPTPAQNTHSPTSAQHPGSGLERVILQFTRMGICMGRHSRAKWNLARMISCTLWSSLSGIKTLRPRRLRLVCCQGLPPPEKTCWCGTFGQNASHHLCISILFPRNQSSFHCHGSQKDMPPLPVV